jgi:di/tricarboxylate transporter
MNFDQIAIFSVLAVTIVLFLSGRWRHDMVALASLLACVAIGLVPAANAFSGFGHPAVITVACVLILSQGLEQTGAVDALVRRILPTSAGPSVTIGVLVTIGAALSAFMNNVGAMALLMPIAVQIARRHELEPGQVLMPLAFGTILGGMTTLIGTPPNLIVSAFRADTAAGSFAMFDYSPTGVAVAAAGILFTVLAGWRLVPRRERIGAEGFDTGRYLTEARIPEDSKAAGLSVREVDDILEEHDAQVIGLVQFGVRLVAPNPARRLQSGDILIIEAEPESLASALRSLGLTLEEQVKPNAEEASGTPMPAPDVLPTVTQAKPGEPEPGRKERSAEEIELQELVVMPRSPLIGRSATDVLLRTRFGLNLLAISRQGHNSISRLRSTPMSAGDVLLLQGTTAAMAGFSGQYACVPLAQRTIRIPDKGKVATASLVMVLAIAGAAFGLLPAAVSFAAAVLLYMVLRIVPPRQIYDAIDWPIIVLLGALIPVASAMASTGAADLLARVMLENLALGNPVIALALILIVTMTLSDFMNNAATAAVMCPIAVSAAAGLGASPDSFLMAVAIGASCAFLTPIGHQNNTLILGPGGFRFGDYWRLGLPMEILVVVVSIPMLLWIWPL